MEQVSPIKKRLFRPKIHWTVMQEIWALPCAACGSRHEIRVDHIIPVKCGGSSARANLQPLCRWCNGIKGGRLMTNQQIQAKRLRLTA